MEGPRPRFKNGDLVIFAPSDSERSMLQIDNPVKNLPFRSIYFVVEAVFQDEHPHNGHLILQGPPGTEPIEIQHPFHYKPAYTDSQQIQGTIYYFYTLDEWLMLHTNPLNQRIEVLEGQGRNHRVEMAILKEVLTSHAYVVTEEQAKTLGLEKVKKKS